MKSARTTKIAVDVAMAAAFVATMATAIVQEAPHEYLGVALFALVVAHIVLNRKWLAALPRMRRSALLVAQVVTLVVLVACIVGAGGKQPRALQACVWLFACAAGGKLVTTRAHPVRILVACGRLCPRRAPHAGAGEHGRTET